MSSLGFVELSGPVPYGIEAHGYPASERAFIVPDFPQGQGIKPEYTSWTRIPCWLFSIFW